MKLSDLSAGAAQPDQSEWPYAASSLADPPITLVEALAVDLGRVTTLCWLHRGHLTHLNVDRKVYFCPIGGMYWRYSKRPSEFLRPLRYPKVG
jgi:hypothetical protein